MGAGVRAPRWRHHGRLTVWMLSDVWWSSRNYVRQRTDPQSAHSCKAVRRPVACRLTSSSSRWPTYSCRRVVRKEGWAGCGGQGGRTRVPLQLAARHQRCRATAGAAGRACMRLLHDSFTARHSPRVCACLAVDVDHAQGGISRVPSCTCSCLPSSIHARGARLHSSRVAASRPVLP